jgi:hypothetical protein
MSSGNQSDCTTVCLNENVKIQLYEAELFLLELRKMNMKVGLYHASDNVLTDNKNSYKTFTLEQNYVKENLLP